MDTPQQTSLQTLVHDLAERVAALEAAETLRQERIAELEAMQQKQVDEAFRVIDLVSQTQHVFDARANAAEAARAVAQVTKGEH